MWRALMAIGIWLGALTGAEAQPAAEGGPPRLAVLLVGEADRAKAAAVSERDVIDQAYQHSGEKLAWRLVAYSRAEPDRSAQRVLAELDQAVEAGKKAYRYMKLDEAERIFENAAAALCQNPVVGCRPEKMAEMMLYWARAVLDSGEELGAQVLLGQLVRFDPDAAPDPAVMPPNLVATFDLALDERRGRERAKVLLQSGPAAASLYADCRRLRGGVVEFSGVAGDPLLLAVACRERMVFGQSLSLVGGPRRWIDVYCGRPGQRRELEQQLAAWGRAGGELAALAGRPSAALDAAADALGVRLLLLAAPGAGAGDALRLGLYVRSSGLAGAPLAVAATASGRPEPDALAAAVEELAARVRSPSVLAALEPAPAAEPKVAVVESAANADGTDGAAGAVEPGPAWWESWWFWTAAGAVVAGGVATGLALGLDAGGSQPSGRVVLTIAPP